jgi:hypothetical protein
MPPRSALPGFGAGRGHPPITREEHPMIENTPNKPAGGLKAVRDFFGMKLADMKNEWTNGGLTDQDKAEILAGLTDGSLTY